jgi:prepilin-type processing-associated H-X9-DG protein
VTNGIAPKKGLLELAEAPAAGWTEAIHNEAGNVGLADGSVQQLSTMRSADR